MTGGLPGPAFRRRLSIAAALLGLACTEAPAQETPRALDPNSGIGGTLGPQSARGPDEIPFDCYQIEVPAGTEVTLSARSGEFRPVIWVARGAQCSSAAIQEQSSDSGPGESTVSFTAAGGRYLIFARGQAPDARGRYRIRVVTVGSEMAAEKEGLPPTGVAARNRDGPPAAASGEDGRLALMRRQVAARQAEIAAEEARKAEEERQRQLALARAREEERQRQLAAQQSGGDSGLFGALAFGFGAAMAGGNAEVVMGAAMKGMEMTTDNEQVRSAIAGQGDAMIASGLDRMGGGRGYGTGTGGSMGMGIGDGGGGGGSYPTRPNALGGSAACSMMNESNYRDVGLSGGNDVQLKTMCAQAYEYYTMYKRAIAQGYSEADANRTYDAHQKAAMNAIHFYENNR